MTRHLELIVHELLRLVGGWIFALCMCVLAAVLVAAFLGLNLYKHDRDSFRVALDGLLRVLMRGWGWMLVAAAVLLQIFGLATLHRSVTEHLRQQGQARYGQASDAGGGPTVQRAPSAAFLETSTRSQRLVVPAPLVSLLPTAGVSALPGWSPEEARLDRPAVSVEDRLVGDGKALQIERTTTVDRYVPLKLGSSDVRLRLGFRDRRLGERRQSYRADFQARYTFHNPFPEKRKVRFTFPLPENSGTLENFRFRVDGAEVPPQDIAQGVQFDGEVEGGASRTVEVAYVHTGAGAWSYDVAGRREAIASFRLAVEADKGDIRFLRGSLCPTEALDDDSGTRLTWDLRNQVTSQSVSLYFPSVSQDELVNRLYVFCPLALLGLLSSVLTWARLRRSGVGPWAMVLVTSSWCTGAALSAYLLDDVRLPVAIAAGFGSAAVLQLMVVGMRLWLPVAATLLVPFAFLSPTHSGLLLSILGIVVLAATAWETRRVGEVSRAPGS